ncbi:Na+/H+ antiporter NhaA [Motiliproteus sp.]|uniref:Na+/H+ antiporter NhaA n=1 Tax=Motiliproteus sp. TaxID=1898955 RepID=UPI003BAB65D8
MITTLRSFLRLESASGIVLVLAAALALILANSPLSPYYDLLLDIPVQVRIGKLDIDKPLLLWINDGLMVIFFFLIGLELKREAIEGELSDIRKVTLPALGAIGGMAVPGIIYFLVNQGDPVALRGWAIPTATDIAFVLGILALLGNRVPITLKVFLVSLAIFDDIGAIAIIALFYTESISESALGLAGACMLILLVLNRRRVMDYTPYILIGVLMWIAILKSGIHATLAGVILAMFIPLKSRTKPGYSPLKSLEHDLHGTVAFGILPIFAFANSGVPLAGISADFILHPVTLGIALGLFLGKQIGVFLFCWIGIKLGLAKLPEGIRWSTLYGAALLCGVGFTMSLFIGSLAFEDAARSLFDERLGVMFGSLVCGISGFLMLRATLKDPDKQQPTPS